MEVVDNQYDVVRFGDLPVRGVFELCGCVLMKIPWVTPGAGIDYNAVVLKGDGHTFRYIKDEICVTYWRDPVLYRQLPLID